MSTRGRDGARRGAAAGQGQRQLRVGEELRHALVEILRDSHARDPELQDINVTVTEVRISPDLKHATAFVMPLGGTQAALTVAALNRAAPYFRARLARTVQLRHAPSIGFAIDTSFGYAERIEGLLRAPEVLRDIEPAIKSEPEPKSEIEE